MIHVLLGVLDTNLKRRKKLLLQRVCSTANKNLKLNLVAVPY